MFRSLYMAILAFFLWVQDGQDNNTSKTGEKGDLWSEKWSTNVLKRHLANILTAVEELGLPSESEEDIHVQMKLSGQAVKEIQAFLNGEEECPATNILDKALGQNLLKAERHDFWNRNFIVIIAVILILAVHWRVSWFKIIVNLIGIIFISSIMWNWIYLYQTAQADRQYRNSKTNIEKCLGLKDLDWTDYMNGIGRWLTLQEDPCKEYFRALVDLIWLVPPAKALTHTITAVFTDPLKQLGQGINDFLTALLKDLPFVHVCIVTLLFAVLIYVGVPQLIRHGSLALQEYWQRPHPLTVECPQRDQVAAAKENELTGQHDPIQH
ncbi:chloride channel CLIC-like protein 1 isoform X2 [Denticeps clupeoides]|uniref:Chloride channel CLIC-like protein 1 n=1 Tax=Denticeps clupeoides TaxID=299321 RepID=A0AAY4AP48_9TELE|nr:chloride channel CLIC-like protein 1 isoform X2 [Denticeps clupeoides]